MLRIFNDEMNKSLLISPQQSITGMNISAQSGKESYMCNSKDRIVSTSQVSEMQAWHTSMQCIGRHDRMVVRFLTTCAISTYHV